MQAETDPLPIEPVSAVAIVPSGVHCQGCGYDLSGSAVWKCSECGRIVTDYDAASMQRRAELLAEGAKILERTGLRAAMVIGVMSIGACIATQTLEGAFAGFMASTLAIGGWALGGWFVSRHAPRDGNLRSVYFYAWLRSSWMLHAPWLSIAVFAALAVTLALVFRIAGAGVNSADRLAIFVCIEFLAWVGLLIPALIRSEKAWFGEVARLGLKIQPTSKYFRWLYILCIAGSVCTGLAGGAAGTFGAFQALGGGALYLP